MLREPSEIEKGMTVYLYPQTKTASRACHEQRVVKVMKDPAAHWPMVVVTWTDANGDQWELVHRDNIRKKPPSTSKSKEDKNEGDNIRENAGRGKGARVRKMPGRAKPIDIPDHMEQGALF
jgi:predicted lipoprotein with Yx(FWY)xxD motif